MQIKLDSATTSALQTLAQQRGQTIEKLIEEMVKSQVQQQQPGSVRHLPFTSIYDTANGSWRFDADDSSLKDQVRLDISRDLMIARMKRGQHSTSELSEDQTESQARERYIERLKSRKSR